MKVVLAAMAAFLISGFAIAPLAVAESGRYSLRQTDDGIVRLDTETGAISHCSFVDSELVCRLSADERSAYETRIAELEDEIAALREEGLGEDVPSMLDEDAMDDAMTSFEALARRFMDSMRNLKDDFQQFQEDMAPETEPALPGRPLSDEDQTAL